MRLSTKKVIISILLGLVGFVGSYYSLNFINPQFSISIEWCDAMPLLAGMAFGPQYALIAATLGLGAFYPFALYANNGWGNVVTSILLVMTYSAVGYFTLIRYRKPAVWNHPLLVYPIIALIYNLLFRLLFPIALSFNPPFWYLNAALSIPLPVLDGIVVKSFVILNVLILINDLLLKLPFIRGLLGLQNKKESRFNERIALGILLVFTALWFVFVLFNRIFIDQTFPQGLFQPIHPHETIAAILFLAANVVIASVVIRFMESRLKAEDELEKSEENYRLIFDQAADGIFITDEKGHYVDVNESGCNLTGYTRDEVLQLSAADLIMPEEETNVPVRVNSINAGDSNVFERIMRHKNGSPIQVEISARKLADGRLQGLVHDISDHKRTEKALKESAARFQSLFDDSPISLWEEDFSVVKKHLEELRASGVHDFNAYLSQHPEVVAHCLSLVKMIKANKASLSLYEAASLVDLNNLPILFPEEGYGTFRDELVLIASGATHFELETINLTLDGKRKILNLSWSVVQGYENDLSRTLVSLIDITDRKQAEAKINFQATLLGSVGQAVIATDMNGIITYFNRAAEDLYSWPTAEAVGRNIMEVTVPETSLAQAEEIMVSLSKGLPWSGEFNVRRRDGTVFPAVVSDAPVLDETGILIGIVGVSTDITARKAMEETLRAGEERYRQLFEGSPLGYQSLDADGCFIEVNQSWLDTLGYQRQEVIGRWFGDFLVPEMVAAFRERFPRFKAAGEVHNQFQMVHKNGDILTVSFDGKIGYDEKGQFKQTHCIINDITLRQKIEKALQESEKRFRLALQNAPLPIMLHAEDGEVILISQTWSDLSGYTLKDIPTTTIWAQKAYGERKQVVKTDIDNLYDLEGRKNEGEYVIRTKDGNDLIWEFSSSMLGKLPDGRRLVISMAMDVTARKQAEEKLHAAYLELKRLLEEADESRAVLLTVVEDQKITEEKLSQLNDELDQRVRERTVQLEATNRELEAFAYSVSHDLRAPLRGIDGMSAVLLEDYQDRLDEQGQHYLERVRSETQRMGHMIEDILQLSRITRVEMKREPVNLTLLAQSILDRLQETESDRQVRTMIDPDMIAFGDPNLLEIMVTNLLSNAWKFTGKQPQAVIEFGSTLVAGQPAFFIRDNGAGFDIAYAKNLFGAFQRMHKQSDFPGTGIGLATVQRIIHRHGGKVWAEAQKDLGATFYFTFEENG